MTGTDIGPLYARLIDTWICDEDRAKQMMVLADALMDGGHDELAAAFRWAADRGKWPFRRTAPTRQPDGQKLTPDKDGKVYDWQNELSELAKRGKVPVHAHLPHDLIRLMVQMLNKMYTGQPADAFCLLANALAGNTVYVDYLRRLR